MQLVEAITIAVFKNHEDFHFYGLQPTNMLHYDKLHAQIIVWHVRGA